MHITDDGLTINRHAYNDLVFQGAHLARRDWSDDEIAAHDAAVRRYEAIGCHLRHRFFTRSRVAALLRRYGIPRHRPVDRTLAIVGCRFEAA